MTRVFLLSPILVLALASALYAASAFGDIRTASLHSQRETTVLDSRAVEDNIKDILSAPEYNRTFERRKSLWEVVTEFIVRRLGDFFRWMLDSLGFAGISSRASRALAWAVIGVFAAAAAVIVLRLAARARYHVPGTEAESAAYELPSSARLMAEAAESARSGDYRSAFLKAYLASIAYLDEAEALRFARSRTNWEYLRELRGKGFDEVADHLFPLTASFDRKFYGSETCTRTDYDSAIAVYTQVRERLAA